MLEKIQIHYNPNGDARTLDHIPDYDELKDAVETHRDNMQLVFKNISNYALERARNHDKSVSDNFDDYYVATVAHLNKEVPFRESDWYKAHFADEAYRRCRTHLESATLFDLIEAVCDHVVTLSEEGNDPRGHLDKEQVYRIYMNTVAQLQGSIETIL